MFIKQGSSVLGVFSFLYHAITTGPEYVGSSNPKVFYNKSFLKRFAKFNGKHLCRSFFLIKLQSCSLQLNYEGSPIQVFFVNSGIFLRRIFLQNTSRRLFLACLPWWYRTYLFSFAGKYVTLFFYKQLGSCLGPQSCLYFQGFRDSKLLNGCLVV